MIKKSISILSIIALLFVVNCADTSTIKDSKGLNIEQQDWTKKANIYEVNVRQYSEEGTFEEVRKDLPRLKDMGVKILWLMPIHPIGLENRKETEESLGSYYSVQDYKGVNPNFGTPEDFKRFVDEAHALDMKVIIDWVANHTAWDNHWIENKDWFELTEEGNFTPPRGTDWSDVIQLNYENQEMRAAMIDALVYWVREFDIDGYRCDVAGMVPNDFWKEAISSLQEIKPVFMLAEDGEAEIFEGGFHMNYAWEYAHVIREIEKGEKSFNDLTELLERSEAVTPSSAYRMYFTSNHDENSWNGTDSQMFGKNFENFAVLSATISGMPLIYNGQESGLEKRLEFFEKDEIEWAEYKYQEFYKNLLTLKRENEALWNGSFGGDLTIHNNEGNTYSYIRVKGDAEVVVALNFDNESSATFSLENLGVNSSYTVHNGNELSDSDTEVSLAANTWIIFEKR